MAQSSFEKTIVTNINEQLWKIYQLSMTVGMSFKTMEQKFIPVFIKDSCYGTFNLVYNKLLMVNTDSGKFTKYIIIIQIYK